MVKLTFKAYKKIDNLFYNFIYIYIYIFIYINVNGILSKKQRKAFKKKVRERYQSLSEEEKMKIAYMLVNIIKKKKKKRMANMVQDSIKIF